MGTLQVSTDKDRLDIGLIHRFLSTEAYWSRGIPRATVERAIAGSLCFGGYLDGQQVAFARVVTDGATFGYLADVFVLPEYRGQGHAKALMASLMAHPQLQGLRRFSLATSDAHELYAAFGFAPPAHPQTLMEKFDPHVYACARHAMNPLLQSTLEHLGALVGFDTRNPPRAIGTGGIFDYLRAQLPGFEVTVTDHGAGAVTLHAVRGQPRLLFNVHLDTVPDSPAWSADPHTLRVKDDRAIGLGACDIKGAAAALLAVAAATDGPLGLLFSTDEEANDARCIAGFLQQRRAYEAVIVAEPTRGEAVLAHRGIQSVLMRFAGQAGHASGAQRAGDSAVHQAIRWGNAALDFVIAQSHERFGGLTGLRFNIGRVEGGIKANMIAPATELRFGFRPLPTMDADQLLARFHALAELPPAHFEETFRGASLPAGDTATAEARRLAARDLADELEIPVGNAVDFWTEAALFSAAGYIAFVYGPGDIAQAHSADEWVALDQLDHYAQTLHRIVDSGNA